jgi:hypothetical protein
MLAEPTCLSETPRAAHNLVSHALVAASDAPDESGVALLDRLAAVAATLGTSNRFFHRPVVHRLSPVADNQRMQRTAAPPLILRVRANN